MPYTEMGLPFQSGAGAHTSRKAAVAAQASRQTKTSRYLRHLAKVGPQTDWEASVALGLPLSSVCSIRNGAINCGLVERGSTERPSPFGKACAVWLITIAGRLAVKGIKSEAA
jgi:hypothetical protein